jgi:hypothetical protein
MVEAKLAAGAGEALATTTVGTRKRRAAAGAQPDGRRLAVVSAPSAEVLSDGTDANPRTIGDKTRRHGRSHRL